MRFLSRKQCGITAALAVCAFLSAAGAGYAQETKPAGWYVGLGLGINKTSTLEQAGHNRDNTCYPEDDCSHLAGGAPEGYRWYYDLDADDGAAFEISVGRTLGAFRLELALAQRKNDVEQKFTDITYLDGSRSMPRPVSNYESRASASVDALTTRTLSLNAYYDFSLAGSRFTPYLGAGAGVSFVELSGVYFEAWYSCKNPASDCDMPEQYNGRQNEDLTDTVLSAHLHAGLDYRMSDKMQLGLKLTYSVVGDMEDVKGGYDFHPVAGLSNFTTISGMNHWSVMFGVKYFFGE
ncbi:MAG: outer membrane beta-barrel protein [Nitrospinae bacterium]|nr:outer membrane beta-barrel protein [Nitrospinota bacterium]